MKSLFKIFTAVIGLFVAVTLVGCDGEKDLVVIDMPEEEMPHANIYMLGMASGQWDSNDGLQMEVTGKNTFAWEGQIHYSSENKQFKFCMSKGNWDAIDFLVPENADADGYIEVVGDGTYKLQKCSQPAGTLKDAYFGIAEGADGIYRLEVNVKTLTLTVKKK